MENLFEQAVAAAEKKYEGKKMHWIAVGIRNDEGFVGITIEGEKIFSASGTMKQCREAFVQQFLNDGESIKTN